MIRLGAKFWSYKVLLDCGLLWMLLIATNDMVVWGEAILLTCGSVFLDYTMINRYAEQSAASAR